MNILSVNSAGSSVSVALKIGTKTDFIFEGSFKKASEVLLSNIELILSRNGIELCDIDIFGIAVGPGSFTGIRIGITTIRAFSQVYNKPVVPVTNCDVLSYNVIGGCDDADIIAVSDAGNGLYYIGVYDCLHNPIRGIEALEHQEIFELLDSFVKPFIIACECGLENMFDSFKIIAQCGDCGDLIKAVDNAYKNGKAVDYEKIEPVYIRKFQAEKDLELKEQKNRNYTNEKE